MHVELQAIEYELFYKKVNRTPCSDPGATLQPRRGAVCRFTISFEMTGHVSVKDTPHPAGCSVAPRLRKSRYMNKAPSRE